MKTMIDYLLEQHLSNGTYCVIMRDTDIVGGVEYHTSVIKYGRELHSLAYSPEDALAALTYDLGQIELYKPKHMVVCDEGVDEEYEGCINTLNTVSQNYREEYEAQKEEVRLMWPEHYELMYK